MSCSSCIPQPIPIPTSSTKNTRNRAELPTLTRPSYRTALTGAIFEPSMTAPGPISPTATTSIPVRGGALYAETFLPAGTPRGVVLVTHGYAEHCGRYRELAHVITQAGWAVLAYDVRGHGQSFGARGAVDRFASYLDDLTAVHAAARALAPGAPLVLLGHSHGSLITLRALCDERAP